MTTEMHENEDGPGDTDAAVQLGNEETLDGPLGADPLDAGFSPNDRPIAMDDFGTTAEEMAEGESLDSRLAREQPETEPTDEFRSGRLVEPDEGVREDADAQLVATDVGIDGGAASAEEAAVHDVPADEAFAGDGTDEDTLDPALAEEVEEVTEEVDELLESDSTPEVAAAEADAQHDAEDDPQL